MSSLDNNSDAYRAYCYTCLLQPSLRLLPPTHPPTPSPPQPAAGTALLCCPLSPHTHPASASPLPDPLLPHSPPPAAPQPWRMRCQWCCCRCQWSWQAAGTYPPSASSSCCHAGQHHPCAQPARQQHRGQTRPRLAPSQQVSGWVGGCGGGWVGGCGGFGGGQRGEVVCLIVCVFGGEGRLCP